MTVQAALAELVEHLREHAQELSALRTIVREDAPSDRSAFIDRLGESVENARGLAEEALAAAQAAFGAVTYPPDVGRARRDVAVAHRSLAQLGRSLVSDVGSSRHLDELRRLTDERGDGWTAWAGVVQDTIERCIEQLHGLHDDLAGANAEIVDPELVSVAVSVHTSNPVTGQGPSEVERMRTTERLEELR